MSIDLTIDNYSVDDLILLFGGANANSTDVQETADNLIKKFNGSGKPEISDFFRDASRIVIDHINTQNNDKYNNETLSSEDSITSLWKQSSPFMGDSRVIQPEPTFVVPTERELSITTQHVIIDSQFRPNVLPYSDNPKSNSFNTNFSFYLSKSVSRAISMRLISITIPTSWYTFSELLGNTFFTYRGQVIKIEDGNYTTTSLIQAINSVTSASVLNLILSIDPISNRIKFKNTDTIIDGSLNFFEKENMTNFNECSGTTMSGSVNRTFGVNSTLGWMLGFRITPDEQTGNVSAIIPKVSSLIAQSMPDVYGSKFFTLSLEEFSNQRLTKGLSNIFSNKQRLFMNIPEFYSTTKAECQLQRTPLTHAQQLVREAVSGAGESTNTNESSLSTYKIAGYHSDSAFAVIPLDASVIITNRLLNIPYQLSGVDMEIFKRYYKTPTIIEKIKVSLTDDKGNLVNLHGCDWSFVIIIEEQN